MRQHLEFPFIPTFILWSHKIISVRNKYTHLSLSKMPDLCKHDIHTIMVSLLVVHIMNPCAQFYLEWQPLKLICPGK